MKMVEISYMSNMKELEKLSAKLERAQKALAKKQAAAEKAGVAEWTKEQHIDWLKGVETTEWGFIANKADIKKNGAWIDLMMAQDALEEVEGQIENAERRFEKAERKLSHYREEQAAIRCLKDKEALWKVEFEQEQREWAKDGITLEERYRGLTPAGRGFSIVGNSGWTDRSRHCFTLYIEGRGCVFTSGEFWRAYREIKNS